MNFLHRFLAQNEAAIFALRSYTAECWSTIAFSPGHRFQNQRQHNYATLIAIKPNLIRYETWDLKKTSPGERLERQAAPNSLFVCDGRRSFRQIGKTYRVEFNIGPEYMNTTLEPLGGFYTRAGSMKGFLDSIKRNKGTIHELTLLPPTKVDTTLCKVVSYHVTFGNESDASSYKGRLFIDSDRLVRRKTEEAHFGDSPGFTLDSVLRKIRTNFPYPPQAIFAYRPPAGVEKEIKKHQVRKPVLANGKSAPDFLTLTIDDKPVRLSDFKGRVVVLDFWATWCGPCMSAMPTTNKIAREYKEKEVVVLGVNVWDEKETCMNWIKKKQSTYESMVFVLDPAGSDPKKQNIAGALYSVSGIPTQFVIDRNGIVRASLIGANPDETPLRNAIEEALKL